MAAKDARTSEFYQGILLEWIEENDIGSTFHLSEISERHDIPRSSDSTVRRWATRCSALTEMGDRRGFKITGTAAEITWGPAPKKKSSVVAAGPGEVVKEYSKDYTQVTLKMSAANYLRLVEEGFPF